MYVKSEYLICSMMFDDNKNGPSAKNHKNKRKSQKSKPRAGITAFENIPAYRSQCFCPIIARVSRLQNYSQYTFFLMGITFRLALDMSIGIFFFFF